MWGYIWWRGLDYNPLYEQDFERIGCYLCASCLESEWKNTSALHPETAREWRAYLDQWSKRVGVGPRVRPVRLLALEGAAAQDEAAGRGDQPEGARRRRSDRLELRMTKGVSPCLTGGYSIEGVLIAAHEAGLLPGRRGR